MATEKDVDRRNDGKTSRRSKVGRQNLFHVDVEISVADVVVAVIVALVGKLHPAVNLVNI